MQLFSSHPTSLSIYVIVLSLPPFISFSIFHSSFLCGPLIFLLFISLLSLSPFLHPYPSIPTLLYHSLSPPLHIIYLVSYFLPFIPNQNHFQSSIPSPTFLHHLLYFLSSLLATLHTNKLNSNLHSSKCS